MKLLKYTFLSLIFIITLKSCKDTTKTVLEKDNAEIAYTLKGEAFEAAKAQSCSKAITLYKDLKPGDSIDLTFKSSVKSVCKSKGCWMTLYLDDDNTAMVKFKDYGFFVPKDIDNETVIVNGKAFVNEVSVEEQRHYAEDAGASQEDIDAITEPKRTYSFLANGVLIETPENTTSDSESK